MEEPETAKTISITYTSQNHLSNVVKIGTTDRFSVNFVVGFVLILDLETGTEEFISSDLIERIKIA